jgi:hypothetical protein
MSGLNIFLNIVIGVAKITKGCLFVNILSWVCEELVNLFVDSSFLVVLCYLLSVICFHVLSPTTNHQPTTINHRIPTQPRTTNQQPTTNNHQRITNNQ